MTVKTKAVTLGEDWSLWYWRLHGEGRGEKSDAGVGGGQGGEE